MTTTLLRLFSGALALSALSCRTAPPPVPPPATPPARSAAAPRFVERDGLVVIEAENFTRTDGYGVAASPEASGGALVEMGKQPVYRAHYDFDVVTGGRYHVWVRHLSPDSGRNSIFMEVDGKKIVAPDEPKYRSPRRGQPGSGRVAMEKGDWNWNIFYQTLKDEEEGPVVVDLSPGRHRFSWNGARRERPYLDRVVFSKGTQPPTGDGPPSTMTNVNGAPVAVEKDGVIAFEAEEIALNEGFAVEDRAGAIGKVAVLKEIEPQRAHYEVTLTSGGRYHLWIRHRAQSPNDNGVALEWNGKRVVAPAGMKSAGSKSTSFKPAPDWNWDVYFQMDDLYDGPLQIEAPAGQHVLTLSSASWERPLIDKFVISRDASAPVGLGPAETREGGAAAHASRRP